MMDLPEMTLTELKAFAYDLLAQMEKTQMQLQEVNRRIAAEMAKQKQGIEVINAPISPARQ